MEQVLAMVGVQGVAAVALLLGAALGAAACFMALRRQRVPAQEELAKLRRSLRNTQVKLDQARKNAEALEVEVTEWRRRNSQRQAARTAGNSRYVTSTPAPEPDAWVIGALLEDDQPKAPRGGTKPSGFADTQILPAH